MRNLIFLFPLISLCSSALSQNTQLTIPMIMQGESFVGHLPGDVIWAENSKSFYFKWKEVEPGVKPYYEYDLEVNAITQMDANEAYLNIPSNGDYSEDGKMKVYSKSGDIFLFDGQKTQRLTNTLDYESNPKFLFENKSIVYQKENNLYIHKLEDGSLKQITDFKSGAEKKDKSSQMAKWLENDQLAIFDILSERKSKRENEKEFEKSLKSMRPKTIYYGDKDISSIQLSPDGKYVYYQLSTKTKNISTDNLDFVTGDGYTNVLKDRPKVGSDLDTEELWVYQIQNDTMLEFSTEGIPGIYEKPAFYEIYNKENASKPFEEPRKILIHGPDIHENGKAVVEIKSQDNKDRWFMLVDPEKASWKMIERQHDDAWVGGPGIEGWNMVAGNKGWMPDGEHYWFHSEESGYSHLYSVNVKSGKEKALTKGNYEVHDAWISKDKNSFYIVTNQEDPGERHLYKMSLDGKETTKLTNGEGNHEIFMSPDEKYFVSRYSYSNKPWELYLQESKDEAEPTKITESLTDEFKEYNWRVPELVYFKASDGAKVRARLYKPEDSKKNSAAVIFVHGAGYLQNVHKWWSSYYREYMFHNLLTDLGYTVLDIDYRASEGYGRDWRTGIYRHMGGKDLSDQVDGAKYLVSDLGIDKERIGIYGGSYGGFITLMALFNESETFACGAALRSVTDWAHYNHPYTANILNTPVEDSLAFRQSSPIYFAEGLEDPLVMLHGVVDTNVQFQDIVRLSQKLIELGKTDWDLAVFPVEGHGFKEASSWTDEYRRILELFEENLKE